MYHGITLSVQFAAPSSGSGTIDFSDALNNGDVTPNTLPADSGTSGATSGYTAIIYISAVNTGSQDISFGAALPTITVGDSSLNGTYTTCNFDAYGKTGSSSTPTWFATGASGSVNANGVVVGPGTLPAGSTVDFKADSQQIIAVSCH